MEKVFVRSAYNYDRDKASDEAGLSCSDVSLAKQSFADECDINTIVRRFGLMGQLPENVPAVMVGDFTEVYDFHSAMNTLRAAQEMFMAMPADVRSRFGNDPGAFVNFCSEVNDKGELVNLVEMRKLGLALPAKVVASAAPAPAAAPGSPSLAPSPSPAPASS